MCNNNIWQLRQCNRLLFQLLLSCLEFSGCGSGIYDMVTAAETTPVAQANLAQAQNFAQVQSGCGCGCGCGF